MKTLVSTKIALSLAMSLALGCSTADPTVAILDNAFSASDADPGAGMTVLKAWWFVAEFPDPTLPGQESENIRVVPGTDYAYALLAPGWDPTSGAPPTNVVPIKTTERLSIDRGGTLRVSLSNSTTVGNCAAGRPLSSEDAKFIVERIFPGDFAGRSYDPATCTAVQISDGGREPDFADSESEGGETTADGGPGGEAGSWDAQTLHEDVTDGQPTPGAGDAASESDSVASDN